VDHVSARQPAWIATPDRAQAVADDNPIALMRELERCAAAGGAGAGLLAKLRAGLARWEREGGTFEHCMGWRVPPGGKHKTARARLLREARRRIVLLLTLNVAGMNPNQQAEAILPIVTGQAAAPNDEARRALEDFHALGGALPRSKGGVYSLVRDVISGK
jgi:hypothetical protein